LSFELPRRFDQAPGLCCERRNMTTRRRAHEAFVLLGLLASAALAGCSSIGGVTEASADRFSPEAIPRPPQSIPFEIKLSETPKKGVYKPPRLKHASAIKSQSINPTIPAEPKSAEPKSVEPTPALPQASPVDRLPSLYPDAPPVRTFSR
jgi:hypothetical protein